MPDCFVIAPIGKEDSPIRRRSDQIFNYVIKPIAKECGFDAVRSDHIKEPGTITSQVLNHVLGDPMVVADLTGNNGNVFYELAVRHAAKKPFVQIIQKGEPIPFDVSGLRTIEIDHTNLDSVEAAKNEMREQMSFTAKNPEKVENPISNAIDYDKLRQSDDPGKRQLAEIMKGMAELNAVVDHRLAVMEKRLVEAKIIDLDIAVRRIHDDVRRLIFPEWLFSREKFAALLDKAKTAPPEERESLMSEVAAQLIRYNELHPLQRETEDGPQEK